MMKTRGDYQVKLQQQKTQAEYLCLLLEKICEKQFSVYSFYSNISREFMSLPETFSHFHSSLPVDIVEKKKIFVIKTGSKSLS